MKVVAAAGRRVDAPDSETPRFPLDVVPAVAERIERVLRDVGADAVVASAAAGADVLVLEAAQRLGLRTVVVLPFERDRFEKSSVADRPGQWTARYRTVLDASEVEVLPRTSGDDDEAYAAVTEELLARAIAMAGVAGTTAVVVWDGSSRGPSDQTARFADRARERNVPVVEVSTMSYLAEVMRPRPQPPRRRTFRPK
jgi:hypothetical protein